MDHYIIVSLGKVLSRPCPCLSTECVLGDGHQGNFQNEKGPFWNNLAIVELILKITLQEHLYLHLES